MAFVLVTTAQARANRSAPSARPNRVPLAHRFAAALLKGIYGMLLFLATLPVRAQFADTPSEVDVTNYSGFVIDADEGVAPDASDRSAIKASVTVQFRRSVFNSPATFNYAVAFQLWAQLCTLRETGRTRSRRTIYAPGHPAASPHN